MKEKWYHISTGQFGYPQPEDGYENTTYSKNEGCKTCEFGKEQIAPFRFRTEPKASHSEFLGLNWVFDQIFVREIVKKVFEKEEVQGVRYSRPILHKTGKELDSIYQLHVDNVLSKALIIDNLSSEICEVPKDKKTLRYLIETNNKLGVGPFCGRTKYHFPQGQKMKFELSAFIEQPDFIRTHEWFGSGGSAHRPIILSERAKAIIEKNNWRGAFFEEIELV